MFELHARPPFQVTGMLRREEARTEPVPAAVSDLPVGAWLVAPLFDFLSFLGVANAPAAFHDAATWLYFVGAVSALGAAMTGAAGMAPGGPTTSSPESAKHLPTLTMLAVTILVIATLGLRWLFDSQATGVAGLLLALPILAGTAAGSRLLPFRRSVDARAS